MRRSPRSLVWLALLLCLGHGPAAAEHRARPNIVLMLTDALAQTTNLYHQHPEIASFLETRFLEIMRQNRSK